MTESPGASFSTPAQRATPGAVATPAVVHTRASSDTDADYWAPVRPIVAPKVRDGEEEKIPPHPTHGTGGTSFGIVVEFWCIDGQNPSTGGRQAELSFRVFNYLLIVDFDLWHHVVDKKNKT